MPLSSLMSPSELTSVQIGAVSSGRAPKLNYESYVESMASALPQLQEAECQRKAQEEQIRLNEEARRTARVDANIALGIQGAQLATNPLALKYGGKVLSALRPKPTIATASTYTPPMPSYSPLDSGLPSPYGGYAPTGYKTPPLRGLPMRPPVSAGYGGTTLAEATVPISSPLDAMYGNTLAPLAPTTTTAQGAGLLSRIGSSGNYLGKLGEKAGLSSGIASAGANIATAGINYGINRAIVGKKATGSEQAVSDVATTAAAFALGGPVGAGVNLLSIGGRELFKKCIIVSSACGIDSEEVKIAKEFQEKYMTRKHNLGYYFIADKIVPMMEKVPEFKEFIRTELVEHLLKVGRFKLGYSDERPSNISCIITNNFLTLCLEIGNTMKSYQRVGGEVI